MTIQFDMEFEGTTFVAYSDLSGFRRMLEENSEQAYQALNHFYNTAYRRLDRNEYAGIAGIAVSDCIVSWSSNLDQTNIERAVMLFSFLKELHKGMIRRSYLVTSTVAWGQYRYQRRIELPRFRKGMLYGSAYINAYLANDQAEVGAIVLLRQSCEINPANDLENCHFWEDTVKPEGWEYFWSVSEPGDIERIKEERLKAKNLRFERLKNIYRRRPHRRSCPAAETD